jgi:hypothetical protein
VIVPYRSPVVRTLPKVHMLSRFINSFLFGI